jgi:hypothetical protein
VQNAGKYRIYIHTPINKGCGNGQRVDDIGLAAFSLLAFVRFRGKINGVIQLKELVFLIMSFGLIEHMLLFHVLIV